MKNIYSKVDAILSNNIEFNKKAMVATQAIGYNGFKRMHRCLAKEFLCFQLELANNLFDKYRVKEDFTNTSITYEPATLREHLAAWDARLEADIKALGELNKEHFEQVGVANCVVESALCCLVKKYEKTYRWYKRFEENNWNSQDMHFVDDHIHKKYKKIEGE